MGEHILSSQPTNGTQSYNGTTAAEYNEISYDEMYNTLADDAGDQSSESRPDPDPIWMTYRF